MSYRYISDDTHPFCNLRINYLMNHVTSLSGGVVYVCCGDGVGGGGGGEGGGDPCASPLVGPIQISACAQKCCVLV